VVFAVFNGKMCGNLPGEFSGKELRGKASGVIGQWGREGKCKRENWGTKVTR